MPIQSCRQSVSARHGKRYPKIGLFPFRTLFENFLPGPTSSLSTYMTLVDDYPQVGTGPTRVLGKSIGCRAIQLTQ